MKALFLESLPFESAFHVGSHHYARCFLDDGWEILWISHPLSPLHFLMRDKKDFDVRLTAWLRGPQRYGNLTYVSPFTLLPSGNVPLLRSRPVVRNTLKVTVPVVRGLVRRLGFEEPDLAWLTNPIFYPLLDRVKPKRVAMRIADDTSAFKNVPPAIRELEEMAMERADALFVVSRNLYEELSRRFPKAVFLPNGVDYELFSTPAPEPEDMAALPHPRVIYVGATEYWFDAELVASCARTLPEASFVIVGPVTRVIEPLSALDNVFLLGPRPYREIPAYLQHADVGIIPFRRDRMVDSIHPIKLYEYLAAGLPVVATRWREIEAMQAPVALAEREEFCEALSTSLQKLRALEAERDARMAFARGNSWRMRYEALKPGLFIDAS